MMNEHALSSPRRIDSRRKPLLVALSAALLAGCATFSPDSGLGSVSDLTRARTGQPVAAEKSAEDVAATEQRVRQLLGKPLTPDSAVQIALLNNKSLQASLAGLGIAEADLVQAGRLRNPGFSFSRTRGAETEIERGVMFDIAGLLTMPTRIKIERSRFEQAKLAAAAEAVRLASDTRKAYFEALAAVQTAKYMEQVVTAADAGAQLAQKQADVGNWSKLDQTREQLFYADATTRLARARHNATARREQLTRLLGLWGEDAGFTLAERLPDLPKAPQAMGKLEAQAMEQRLDVLMAKRNTEATASSLGLSKASGVINAFDAGYANKSVSGQPRENGYQIALELPLFDWGAARSAKAEAIYMQSVHQTADIAIRARSEVREAYSAYRTTYDIARHYSNDVVPMRKKISEEVLLRYNGMLASVFELLADAREQVASVSAAIEAQRDFWIAETQLQAAVNGNGSGSGSGGVSGPAGAQPAGLASATTD
jgi:outer membrane protein TolC